MTNFRTKPPWQSGESVPSEYSIVAEFPHVSWGWDCDAHYWILLDKDGNRVLGTTSHGSFFICKDAQEWLNGQIEDLKEYIADTRKALRQLTND
jgi:hypothetical protein